MLILGIETSCDETSAAVVEDGNKILSNIVYSQVKDHAVFWGIVPEIASRKHSEVIVPVIKKALETAGTDLNKIDGVAVTCKPGLIGSLLIGLSTAKAICYSLEKTLIGVNHITGHIYSVNFNHKINYPVICLLVSGGHTLLIKAKNEVDYDILGSTRDDAAGEVFDKVGKMLDLGYPGGPAVEKESKKGSPVIDFPRAMLKKDNFEFSFSGVKTAVLYYLKKNSDYNVPDVCASFQEAVFDVLIEKTVNAVKKHSINEMILCGGVAANNYLREKMGKRSIEEDINLYYPDINLCTDNAAMIAGAGYHLLKKGQISNCLKLNAECC